jgi:hypothetical protein
MSESLAAAAVTQPRPVPGPTLAEFEEARERVGRVAQLTPMESSRFLSDLVGGPVHLKCESLQRTRLLQDPWSLQPSLPALTGGARTGGRRGISRQSCPRCRLRGARARHQGHDLHARRRRPAQAAGDAQLRRRRRAAWAHGRGAAAGRRGVRRDDRSRGSSRRSITTTSSSARAPSASRCSTRCQTSRPSSCRSAAVGSPPASRAPLRQKLASMGRPLRVIGVQAAGAAPLPGIDRGGPARLGHRLADHRRRHRGRYPPEC